MLVLNNSNLFIYIVFQHDSEHILQKHIIDFNSSFLSQKSSLVACQNSSNTAVMKMQMIKLLGLIDLLFWVFLYKIIDGQTVSLGVK